MKYVGVESDSAIEYVLAARKGNLYENISLRGEERSDRLL